MTAEEVATKFHIEYERWTADPAWNPPTGGETAVQLGQRMTRAVEEINTSHDDGNVLVVSHKASIRVALCALLGVDVGRFRYRFGCPVGSVSIVEFGTHGPLAEAVADRSHLDAPLRALEGT
jgi:probable phosphoglycerate mutase